MLLTGLFYGALLIALGYHLFLLFSLREMSYLYFVLFILSAILFFATYEGLADQYLWPGLYPGKTILHGHNHGALLHHRFEIQRCLSGAKTTVASLSSDLLHLNGVMGV